VLAVAVVAPQPVVPGAGVADAMVASEAVVDEGRLRAEAEAWLTDAIDAVPARPGSAVEQRVVFGDPATVLIEAARDADLLVVGNHRRGALASAFVGSVAQSCARAAPCPLVLVPEPGEADAV
jgi:nucleotide-binding universal stress UspA family protein